MIRLISLLIVLSGCGETDPTCQPGLTRVNIHDEVRVVRIGSQSYVRLVPRYRCLRSPP